MTISARVRLAKPLAAAAMGLAAMLASSTADAGDELYGWRGFYVGASATYSAIDQDIKFTAPVVASGSADLGGIGFTGLVGYRIPLGSERVRVGVEFDGTVGDHHGSFNGYRFISDYLTTARATLGLHIHPDLLWFVTGGVGFMGINSSSAANGTTLTGAATLADRRISKTVTGGVVGTGLEWDMGKSIHLRGEYLYGAFDSHLAESTVASKKIDTDVHQVRLGVVFSLQNPYDEPHGRGDIDHDRYTRGEPLK